MKCVQHAAHNPKFEKMGLFTPGGGHKKLKDPSTWLKVATILEKNASTAFSKQIIHIKIYDL